MLRCVKTRKKPKIWSDSFQMFDNEQHYVKKMFKDSVRLKRKHISAEKFLNTKQNVQRTKES